MTLGEKIKKLRLDNKMTQSELANKLFVTRQAITNYERDANKPSLDILMAMAEIFGVELSYFVEEKEDKKKKKNFLLPLIIVGVSIFLVIIIVLVIIKTIDNNKYYIIGYYMTLNENIELDIEQIESESYVYDYELYSNKIDERKCNLNFQQDEYISSRNKDLFYYEIYNKIGTDDYRMILIEQIQPLDSMIYNIEYDEKYFKTNKKFHFIAPVESISIVSYDKYNNIICEEVITMNENMQISSSLNVIYDDFTNYHVFGATRYYVQIFSNNFTNYNIISEDRIFIFFYQGDLKYYDDYYVDFYI